MAPSSSMLARAIRRTSAGSSSAFPAAAAAVRHAGNASGSGDLMILGGHPPKLLLSGCDQHSTRRPDSFRGFSSIAGQPGKEFVAGDNEPEFVAEEKDLESDEALWALYQRWCDHYKMERDRDEMDRRFDEFKKDVLHVHQVNNSGLPTRLPINKYSDTPLSEMGQKFHPVVVERYWRLKALGGLTIEWGPTEDD